MPNRSKLLFSIIKPNELALLGAILLVVVLTTIFDTNHSYLEKPDRSIRDIARQTAMLGILALGASMVIISGGIDLSAGSMVALSGTVCGSIMLALNPVAMNSSKPVGLVVLFAALGGTMLVGFAVGTLHTWLVTSVKLPPFIATLATLVGLRSFARALCLWTTGNFSQQSSPLLYINDPFFVMLRGNIWISVGVFFVLLGVTWIILNLTVLGRHVYALGGNEQAARLSGIRTDRIKWFAYCFGSMTASLASIFYLADQSVANPVQQASGHELNAIAAAVVGGCSLQGGVGTAIGTLLGSIFLRVVIDGVAKVIKTNADVYEGLVVGAVVVLAVTFSQIRQRAAGGSQWFAGPQGICVIPVLAFVLGLLTTLTGSSPARGITVGIIVLGLLTVVKIRETVVARGA